MCSDMLCSSDNSQPLDRAMSEVRVHILISADKKYVLSNDQRLKSYRIITALTLEAGPHLWMYLRQEISTEVCTSALLQPFLSLTHNTRTYHTAPFCGLLPEKNRGGGGGGHNSEDLC